MKETKVSQQLDDTSSQAKEQVVINWVDMMIRLWSIRMYLLKVMLVGAVVGLAVSFSIPKEYSVKVILAPEVSVKSGGIASMAASFLGTSLMPGDGNPDALNALLAPEIVSSTPFLLELLQTPLNNVSSDSTFSQYIDGEAMPWWNYLIQLPRKTVEAIRSLLVSEDDSLKNSTENGFIHYTTLEATRLRILREKINVFVDQKTSIITLTVNLQDRVVTAMIAQAVVNKLQKYIVNYKITKARDDCEYWELLTQENKNAYYEAQQRYAQYVDANSNVVYQSTLVERERLQNEMSLAYQVYSQVQQQLQMAKAKVQESKPAFTILEPPVVPIHPSGSGKAMMMAIFAIFFLALAVGWELFLKEMVIGLRRNFSAR